MKKPAITSDRQLKLTLLQRVCLGGLLSRQTAKTITQATGKETTEEDTAALYSVLRKVRCVPDELAPYERRLGMETALDLSKVAAHPGITDFMIDGYEARVLRALLSGWLKAEGTLADRDWVTPIIDYLRA